MFYLLSISLCCAIFFMVFASVSVLCMWTDRLARPAVSALAPTTAANLLFTIRILPVLLASLATFGFVLPALLKFEPRSTSELVGWPLLGLAILGAIALIVMSVRAANIIRSTTLVAAAWRWHSKKLLLENIDIPVYCLDGASAGPSSVLAVLGFFRPKIFVARKVVDTLTLEELMAAVEHERAHVSSFDNLRQLAVKITRLPYWLNLSGMQDSAWTNASEIAADEAALASGISVLDLSAALIKVAALSNHAVVGETVAASHLVPAGPGSSLQARVEHLREILESDDAVRRAPQNRGSRIVIPLALAAITYAACVSAVLPWVHEALEALVR
jgi:beta-lactamase regulating signal transducer with metallopeptidase domain